MERTKMINKQILQVFELSILAKTQPLDTDTVYAYIAKHKMVDFKDAKTPDRTVAVYMLRLVHNSILVRAVGNTGKWVYTTKEQESLIVGLNKTKRTQGRQKNLLNFIIKTIYDNDNITIDEISKKILEERELNNSTVLKNKSIKTTAGKYATLAFHEGKVDRCKINGKYHYTTKQNPESKIPLIKGFDMKKTKVKNDGDVIRTLITNAENGITSVEIFNSIILNKLIDYSDVIDPYASVSSQVSYLFKRNLIDRKKYNGSFVYYKIKESIQQEIEPKVIDAPAMEEVEVYFPQHDEAPVFSCSVAIATILALATKALFLDEVVERLQEFKLDYDIKVHDNFNSNTSNILRKLYLGKEAVRTKKYNPDTNHFQWVYASIIKPELVENIKHEVPSMGTKEQSLIDFLTEHKDTGFTVSEIAEGMKTTVEQIKYIVRGSRIKNNEKVVSTRSVRMTNNKLTSVVEYSIKSISDTNYGEIVIDGGLYVYTREATQSEINDKENIDEALILF